MTYPTRDLTGSVVAITGATAGIGAAAANQLVEAGAGRAAAEATDGLRTDGRQGPCG